MNLLRRLPIDRFLLLLIATVALAALLPASGKAAEGVDLLASFAVALLFFLYGAKLAPKAVMDGLLHWRLQALVMASTFIVFPLLGLAATALLGRWLGPGLSMGLLFLCLLPSTVQSSIAFTSVARGNVPAALCSASVSNLLGMVLTPALVALLLRVGGSGFSTDALKDIGLHLLLPFLLGQAARPLIGGFISRHKLLTSVVDRGSILLVVYAAFSEGMVSGIWQQVDLRSLGLLALADVVILGIVLALTVFAARRAGFSKEDEIVVVFCGSKKSLASGVPMANILFAGHPVGLLVLPLMLFHQIQLFACAALAQRYARRDESPLPAGLPAE
ncbi:bile acid:sodium symporter [Roseomonas sp. ACRSG]|nr:bile acid:sodium symporter [Roseomonas sp. ACRSG]